VTPPRLSVVTTLYRSAGTIDEFVDRATRSARRFAGDDFEIVIVNDGSPDDSADRVRALLPTNPNLVLVDLSRNFGHHLALLEGLRQSRGELVFLIDSDLEEEPEWLGDFHEDLLRGGADAVYGYQEDRKGGRFERVTGRIYWSVFRRLSGLDLPRNVVTCRLMTRRYVDAVSAYREREVSIGAIFAVAGFVQIPKPVRKGHKGSSSYSLRLKLWHFTNAISSFSTKPLSAIFVTGVAVSIVAAALLVYLVAAALLWGRAPSGWTSVVASVWLLGGLTLSALGVIAIYLGKIFSEVKARPRSIIRTVERGGQEASDAPSV
jgi:putative glycosyltransferase